MSKINQIQNALREIDGGAFQKLADSYLKKKGYHKLVSAGSVIGVNKVRTGTPDTWGILLNGKYVFVEYTTQQSGIFAKLKEDLGKCFDEEKTGIPTAEIDEIVFCHTSTLTPVQFRELREICETHGVNLNVFGIDSISHDLVDIFPGLAIDHLGIEVDTGQIITPDEFVTRYGKNKLTTRLNTAFHFREDELQIIEAALNNFNLVIVNGKAGVGKTRLALEGCSRFNEHHQQFKTFCILNRGKDIYQDLQIHFREPGAFLILVDDANRLSNFSYFIHLLQDQRQDQQIKIIATVRDYAIGKVRAACRAYGEAQEVNVQQLTEEQIKGLTEKEYGIRNSLYLDRIVKISKGNPRLAIMAAELAKLKNSIDSINDVSALYDCYFASIRQDLHELDDRNLLKVAGIIAFLRTLDRTNVEMMRAVESAFGISAETIWEAICQLHNMELVDIYENEIAKISDQVLATYLFYLALVTRRVLDFGEILEVFFPKYSQELVDALNPVMEAFNQHLVVDEIRPHVDRFWDKQIKIEKEGCIAEVITIFWFLNETGALLYVTEKIASVEADSIAVKDFDFTPKSGELVSPLSVLGSFRHSNDKNLRIALCLLCDYVEKRPSELPKTLNLFVEHFGFRHTSYQNGYAVQRAVLEIVWQRAEEGANWLFSNIFLVVAKQYLQTKFNCYEHNNRHAFTFIDFDLSPDDPLLALRKSVWDKLFSLCKIPSMEDGVLQLLEGYSTSDSRTSNKEIVLRDGGEIVPFLERGLSPSQIRHCLLVQSYLDKLARCNVPFDYELRKRFESESYDLYKLLAFDLSEVPELNYERSTEHRKRSIEKYTVGYKLENYRSFLSQSIEIKTWIGASSFGYEFKEGILILFASLSERDPHLYPEVLQYYLELQAPLDLDSLPLIKSLGEICGIDKAYAILSEGTYPTQRSWLFGFYCFLPQAETSIQWLNQLLELYRTSESAALPSNWDYLLNYREIDREIISRIAQLLLDREEKGDSSAYAFYNLFNPHCKVNEEIAEHFYAKTGLLKQAYFAAQGAIAHVDRDGKTFNRILDMDPNFIVEYIDWIFGRNKWTSEHDDLRNYSFIWERDDHAEIVVKAAERIFWHEKKHSSHSYFKVFFGLQRSHESQVLQPKHAKLLMYFIETKNRDVDFMVFLFSLISYLPPEDRVQFFSRFVELNDRFDDFTQIPLEADVYTYNGSAVPMLHERATYLETLLPLFDTVLLLKHRHYIISNIKYIGAQIEQEKKNDFVEE